MAGFIASPGDSDGHGSPECELEVTAKTTKRDCDKFELVRGKPRIFWVILWY